jgi:formylmethanofuran dehydrogenase subunit A
MCSSTKVTSIPSLSPKGLLAVGADKKMIVYNLKTPDDLDTYEDSEWEGRLKAFPGDNHPLLSPY